MKFTLLGSGTSQGIPVIGCHCPTCQSVDQRDTRLRCSALVRDSVHSIVIDVGPDFRTQALNSSMSQLDAVFLTHEHNDHVAGLDDVRPMIFKNRRPMPVYGEQRVLDDIVSRFKYAFEPQQYPGAPSFDLHPITPGQIVHIGKIKIEALRVYHGSLPILGFKIQDRLTYMTDTNSIPEDSMDAIKGIPILLLDALRQKSHHSHFSLQESIEVAASIRASRTFLIHLSHLMGPTKEWEQGLPPHIYPSYDGLSFDLN